MRGEGLTPKGQHVGVWVSEGAVIEQLHDSGHLPKFIECDSQKSKFQFM